ncbi:ABC transporter substrate-binding protein [Cohnella sp. REN36]|uniref:ABC transporter substrate-binding protein n=1 Tax=Cohnella sp. REN36 TaxID=2887347 RepID=UPI001D15202E|nr:ABC transporter substrate-binding protein [Cohnella sp. REN36]MCC3377051.1 ABC transporter substrate-binding protein [Cohnella sp. REN36]
MKRRMRAGAHVLGTAAIAGLLLIAGCGADEEPRQGAPSGSSAAVRLPPYVIKWYLPGHPQADGRRVLDEMNRILRTKINATVDLTWIDEAHYADELEAVLASGAKADLVFLSYRKDDFAAHARAGELRDLTNLLSRYGSGIREQVPDYAWDAARVDGRLYGIVNVQLWTKKPAIRVSREMADMFDLQALNIRDLGDLTPFLDKAMSYEGAQKFGFRADASADYPSAYEAALGIESLGEGNPAVATEEDGRLRAVNLYGQPSYVRYLQLMHEWYDKGWIRKDAPTIVDDAADVAADRYIATPASDWSDDADSRYVIQPIAGPAKIGNESIGSSLTAIPQSSADPARALMLCNLLYSDPQLYSLMSYGIEGVHYNLVDGDYAEPIADSGYHADAGWRFGNPFRALPRAHREKAWLQAGPARNAEAPRSPLLGFHFDPSDVREELARCASVMGKHRAGLVTGAVDPDEALPALNRELRQAGIDRLIAEAQRQLDQWAASRA